MCNGDRMRKLVRSWFSSVLLLFLFSYTSAQEYSYKHYDTRDGLAGATVHAIAQDADGFMWFATETGLSRFDGTRFKNYTHADGLPSNEIFSFFIDSENRLWITSFAPGICYYWHGKIYNQQNDKVLKKIKLHSWVKAMAEDTAGNIIINSESESYLISLKRDVVKPLVGLYPFNSLVAANSIPSSALSFSGNVKNIFRELNLPDSNFHFQSFVWSDYKVLKFVGKALFIHKRTGAYKFVQLPNITGIYSINKEEMGTANFDKPEGANIYNVATGLLSPSFLPDYTIHYVFRDIEGNLWLSTKSSGVFRISNTTFKNNTFGNSKVPLSVKDIRKIDGKLYVGTDADLYWEMIPAKQQTTEDIWYNPAMIKGEIGILEKDTENTLINYASSNFLNVPDLKNSCKTLFYSNDTLLVSTASGAYIYKVSERQKIESIYYQRTTCAYKQGQNYYIGTLDGLYIYRDGHIKHPGDYLPLLKSRISYMAEGADSTLWIATYDRGIIGYKNGQVIVHIGQQNGLTSNICQCLFVADRALWVGTDKGLNKVEKKAGGYVVSEKFTVDDGLGNDVINTVFADGNMVYVGTPVGLTYFDETKVSHHSICYLHMMDIIVSGKHISPAAVAPVLRHRDNNIRFEFAGISFLSAGNIRYKFRLLGLDNNWQYTPESFLSYPSLPSGKYTLQIVAINKFDDQSRTLEFSFEISKTIFEETWFQVTVVLLIIFSTWLIIYLGNRRARINEKNKLMVNQQLLELEQMALRAQMNPHFIFNCLNSMQHYILQQDVKSTNFYLSKFAGLVRQTLDNSSKIYITLAEEIAYLTNYIELERLQLAEAFDYQIRTDPQINPEQINVPNMVLQPYVENAIKHGIGSLTSGGRLIITFSLLQSQHILECIIEDNGPGIDHMKKTPGTHESKGMSITASRIKTLNQLHKTGRVINMQIKDLSHEKKDSHGTRITVHFPL